MGPIKLSSFRVVDHRKKDESGNETRVNYHCPVCHRVYAFGNFTIENNLYVLGAHEQRACCGEVRPTPRVFVTEGEVRGFLSVVYLPGMSMRGRVIQIKILVITPPASNIS